MQKTHIDTNNLDTVVACLEQLANAEIAQLSIEQQIEQSYGTVESSAWRKSADKALRTVKAKRRLVTSRLAVLRQLEKEQNVQSHQQHNDYLIAELRDIVTPSSFARCAQRAHEKLEEAQNNEHGI